MWLGFEVEETLRVHIKVVMMNQREKKRKSQSMTTVRKGGGLGRFTHSRIFFLYFPSASMLPSHQSPM